MTKAEIRALEAYPRNKNGGLDFGKVNRKDYQRGYEQAEKDILGEVEKWLRANFHHRNCWNADEFCISLRTYFGIKK